ncbi:hypothetical protein CE91St36_17170 [Christensenellaceae bacterium]|nr:hypothetical protein CE91St36_17170 [Christensenellaceae bacterium]BDF61568.1 hypothetical protein CE91St37_17180 [Christensenellaceae bacterium]
MNKAPELIVMLTHNDRTVENAIEVFEAAKDAPAKYWGFKEVGLPIPDMKVLVQKMKDAGKKTFLEVVDYTEEGCLAGAQIGVDCGFDAVMGTLYFDSVRDLLNKNGMEYMPFVGKLSGRPSVLDGTIEEIIKEAQDLVTQKGIKGFDLLGYRYVGDAVKLNNEFVKSLDVPVCLAGSVQSYQRLDEVKATGAWAFTIGGAFFENKFDGTFAEQITKVVEYMNK